MKTLLLPGINPATAQWLRTTAHKLAIEDNSLTLCEYSLWGQDDAAPDLVHEISLLPPEHFDLVIAKSMGGLLALQAIHQQKLGCDRVILFGIPLEIMERTSFITEALLKIKESSILVVQQTDDKFGKAAALASHEPHCLLEIEGADHQYDNYDLFIKDVADWLGQ